MWFGVWGLGFGVRGLGFGVWGLGFRVRVLAFRATVSDPDRLGFTFASAKAPGFWSQGSGYRVLGVSCS